MASISSYGKYWRASISDRPNHTNSKQLYYPKSDWSKKQAVVSSENLEQRHKNGEDSFDLWKANVKISKGKVLIREMEGKKQLLFSQAFEAYIDSVQYNLAPKTLHWLEQKKGQLLNEYGDFYLNDSDKYIQKFINSGRYSTRKNKASALSMVFNFIHNKFEYPLPDLSIESTRRERLEYTQKKFKDFLIEDQVLQIAEHVVNQKSTRHSKKKLAYYFLLSFYIPRRRGDFMNLKPEWISDTSQLITIGDKDYVPKSQDTELIVPTKEGMRLARIIKDKYSGKEIFTWSPNYPTKEFRKIVDELFPELDKKIHLHNLRDSGIMYLLYEKKMSPQDVMNITGHARFSSLEKYIHRSAKALIQQKKSSYRVKNRLQVKNKWLASD